MNLTNFVSGRSVCVNGSLLRKLRGVPGMTQEELAKEIDYSESVIRRAEKGDRIDTKSGTKHRIKHSFFKSVKL